MSLDDNERRQRDDSEQQNSRQSRVRERRDRAGDTESYNGHDAGEYEGKDCPRVTVGEACEPADGACECFHFVITFIT
jgi:hypothetical protein